MDESGLLQECFAFAPGDESGVRKKSGRRHKIDGESISMFMSGCESLGLVYLDGRLGSIFRVARITGKIFDTIEEAEAPGWS